jgi:hypothetical protein
MIVLFQLPIQTDNSRHSSDSQACIQLSCLIVLREEIGFLYSSHIFDVSFVQASSFTFSEIRQTRAFIVKALHLQTSTTGYSLIHKKIPFHKRQQPLVISNEHTDDR